LVVASLLLFAITELLQYHVTYRITKKYYVKINQVTVMQILKKIIGGKK